MKITIELNGKRIKRLKKELEIEKELSSLYDKEGKNMSDLYFSESKKVERLEKEKEELEKRIRISDNQ